jgi:hypothetical protein
MELRHYDAAVDALERLAREGRMNGDSAAMGCLVSLGTIESEAAISRLRRELSGGKLQLLEQYLRGRGVARE